MGFILALAACAPGSLASPSAAAPTSAPSPSVPSPGGSVDPSPSSPSPTAPNGSDEPSDAPAPTPSPSGSQGMTTVIHVIAPGDTLSSIARRYATTVGSIAFWNRATYPSLDAASPTYDPDRIQVGWQLVVHPGVVVGSDDLPSAWTPVPIPSATARPSTSASPVPSPGRGEPSIVVTAGPRDGSSVALTFDMGGRLDPALAIIDWLIAEQIPATIFPTGSTASGTVTGRAVMERIAAHPELFSQGNHTWDHPDLTALDATGIEAQLTRTEQAILGLTGRSTRPFFRPPYGSHDADVRAVVGDLGWAYTVMWDVDTIDWKAVADGGPTADDIVARVLSRSRAGSIVLMHLGGYHTFEALPRIVAGLRDRGLDPVTLDRLLGD